MSRLFSIFIVILSFTGVGWSQPLEVFLSTSTFYAPDEGGYVETNIMIPTQQLTPLPAGDDSSQYVVEVVLLFKNDDQIKGWQKYRLQSPTFKGDGDQPPVLIDQRRNVLGDGIYSLEAKFTDAGNSSLSKSIENVVIVDFPENRINISDIALLNTFQKAKAEEEQSPFTKSGYRLIPNILSYYPTTLNKLGFYFEIYNTATLLDDDAFLITYAIEKSGNGEVIAGYSRFIKAKTDKISPVLADLNIENLPTGNYNLVVNVKDKLNNLLATKKVFFQRLKEDAVSDLSAITAINTENTFVSPLTSDHLKTSIESLLPIASNAELRYIRTVLKSDDRRLMEQFLYNFWLQRDPVDPEGAFKDYELAVNWVNENYSTQIEPGYATDRGRVYLKYGAPNEMIIENREPGAKPYEIWHYYNLDEQQSSAKFVFYNPTLEPNNYVLIHSTAKGEIYDPQWQFKIFSSFKESGGGNDPDNEQFRDHFGSKVSDYYDE